MHTRHRCPRARLRSTARTTAALATGLALALTLAACGSSAASDDDRATAGTAADDGRTGANPAGCVEDAPGGDDLFADTFELSHAENLTVDYHDTYKVMTVAQPAPDLPARTYVLVQCGTEAPALEGQLEGATTVEIPVRSLYSESTTHLGFIDALGAADVVTGAADVDVIVTPGVRDRVDAGDVEPFAEDYETNTELVIAGNPDVFVTGGGEDPAHETLAEAGVPVVANAEWLETSPLGRAEWIAFFAALTNTEARATEVYEGVRERYEAAAALAAGVEDRPTILTGGLYEGEWQARGGVGVVPRFIEDAGGAYVYADDPSTGSLVLDIETVIADAQDAEFWISPLGFETRAEALALDSRYDAFAAWDAGGVWNSTRQTNDAGGDPVFDRGTLAVDELLLDYIKILHPELVPDHQLVYFEQLPAS